MESELKFKHLNLDYLDLMTDGDAEMRGTMLAMLLDEIPTEMQKMRDCWQQNDLAELKEVSHKMKSTLAFIGNDALTEANKEIELIARGQGVPADLTGFFQQIEANLPSVLEELEAVGTNAEFGMRNSE